MNLNLSLGPHGELIIDSTLVHFLTLELLANLDDPKGKAQEIITAIDNGETVKLDPAWGFDDLEDGTGDGARMLKDELEYCGVELIYDFYY